MTRSCREVVDERERTEESGEVDGKEEVRVDHDDHQRRDLRGRSSAKAWASRRGGRVLERPIPSGAENALRSRPKDEEGLREEQIKKLKQKIGDLVMDMEILKEAVKPYRPFADRTPEES